jgi:hypothetical protein
MQNAYFYTLINTQISNLFLYISLFRHNLKLSESYYACDF